MAARSTRLRVVLVVLVIAGAVGAHRLYVRAPAPRSVEGRLVGLPYGTRPVQGTAKPQLLSLRLEATRRGGETEVVTSAERAVDELQRCTRAEPANDRCWSDLAAAYIEAGRRPDDVRAAARALAAADRALQIAPGRVEALFNRALALETLSLNRPAVVAWRRYLTADGDSRWAAEARERMRVLDTPTSMQIWEASLPQLEAAVGRGDKQAVDALVRAHPQDARFHGERRLLSEWGVAILNGDATRAAQRLAIARAVGTALRDATGERIVADAVSAIDAAPGSWTRTLAEAHAAYGKARELYAARKSTAARSLFEQSAAGFRRTRSAMYRVADFYVMACLSDLGDHAASLAGANSQLEDTPPHYPSLRAHLLWQRGITSNRLGLPFDAADAFALAFELFERQGERLHCEYVRPDLCLSLAAMGRDAEAWRLRLEGFKAVSRHGHGRSLQTALVGAAVSEAASGRWDLAFSFHNLAMDRELEPPNVAMLADTAVLSAEAAHRGGQPEQASRALARARVVVAGLQDAATRANLTSRLQLVEGIVARAADPQRAAELLTIAIDGARTRYSLAEAHLERGHAWRALQRDDEAIADFRASLDLVTKREEGIRADQLRDSYFATADAAAEALVDLLEKRGLHAESLATADRSRTRTFMPSDDETPIDPRRMPRSTLIAHYTALPDRLIVFLVSERGIERVRVSVHRSALREQIDAFTEAIENGDGPAIAAGGRRLHERLIEPIAGRLTGVSELVIVPDTTIAAVPFAALRSSGGKFLVESQTVVHAASAAAFLRAGDRRTHTGTVLAVGDPAFDSRLFPALDRLPAAASEAQALARDYGSAVLLTAAEATPERVLEAMAASRIITIAAHAVLDRRDPSRSALLLASSHGDSGALYLSRIAHLTLRADLVVLTGCRTAAVLEETTPALRSFALAFLAAGSRNVAGSLWDAEDIPARAMSRLFHERLRAGSSPAAALRDAQLAMLRSSTPQFREPRAWSGYQLYGSGF